MEETAVQRFKMGKRDLVPDRDRWQVQGLLGHSTGHRDWK